MTPLLAGIGTAVTFMIGCVLVSMVNAKHVSRQQRRWELKAFGVASVGVGLMIGLLAMVTL